MDLHSTPMRAASLPCGLFLVAGERVNSGGRFVAPSEAAISAFAVLPIPDDMRDVLGVGS